VEETDDVDLTPTESRRVGRPRCQRREGGRREVARLRNELALTLNQAHELLSRLSHAIEVEERNA